MVCPPMSHNMASYALRRSRFLTKRHISQDAMAQSMAARDAVIRATAQRARSGKQSTSWWTNAKLWGTMSALAGWTMSISAIYDAAAQGPEVISLPMTSVLVVYSSLFFRWAYVVKPQNLFLAACHFTNVCAQLNQGRRAIEYKIQNGQREEVENLAKEAAIGGATIGAAILAAPPIRQALIKANLGSISSVAASEAGPFRVHFWAPMSKWLISGASLMDLERPTDRISIPQYSSLTLCGLIHARYALTVIPTNYMLCSVNVALLLSSGWHLGRKLKADYVHDHPKL